MCALRRSAQIEHLAEMRAHGYEEAIRAGMSLDQARKVALVIEESLVNVIRYAYPTGEGEVELSCYVDQRLFCVQLRDRGNFFDPTGQDEPDLGGDLQSRMIGGLGIHFIRQLTTTMKYARKDGGNELIMCFAMDNDFATP